MTHRLTRAAALSLLLIPSALLAQTEKVDYATIARIREEGLQRSQVMDHLSWLSDVYGPRSTGSPSIQQAADWAIRKFQEWGLANPHLERFQFGRGWSVQRFSANMIEPQTQPIIGLPKSYSVGTNGMISAEVAHVVINTSADFDKWRGKLRGKIVLTQPARDVRMLDQAPIVLRMTDKDIEEAQRSAIVAAGRGAAGGGRAGGPGGRGAGPAGADARPTAQQIAEFFQNEGVVALIDRGSDSDISAGGSDLSWQTQRVDGGTIFPGSAGSRTNAPGGLPQATIAVEHYNRMVRILEKGVPVKLELDIKTNFYDETSTPNGFNVIAEIPGSDPRLKDEVVMIGAHFDGVPAAAGATDNATGSAAMMEALRILHTLGIKPRRTIRVALWGGEENGLLGSAAYVREHFGDANNRKPAHAKLSAYYNIDNGTGKIRGIRMQQNLALRPIFSQFMEPLEDLGVEILGPRTVGSTDHASFERAGLNGFQFIQERYEYNSRTHHSNMDFLDRVQREDMIQMATVVAVFAYLTAQRDELLPRKIPSAVPRT